MNNIKKLQYLTSLSDEDLMQAANLTSLDNLLHWKSADIMPTASQLEALSVAFSKRLDEMGQANQQQAHPIHIRLSADYLLNLGITVSDWISLKWGLTGTWGADQLAVGLFDQGQLVRSISTEAEFIAAFAGYLILQTKGAYDPYIDEKQHNDHYDWRLLRLAPNQQYQDLSQDLISTKLPEI